MIAFVARTPRSVCSLRRAAVFKRCLSGADAWAVRAIGWRRGASVRARRALMSVPRGARICMAALTGVVVGLALYFGAGLWGVPGAAPAQLAQASGPVVQGDLRLVRSHRPGLRVLFVGNSFTAANSMISMLAGMADRGYWPALPIYAVEYAPGGSTLARAAYDPRLRRLLAGVRWDDVVLQEQSQIPTFAGSEAYASFAAGQTLGRLIRRDGARAFMFETWGYLHGELGGTYGNMQDDLRSGYRTLARAVRAVIAPVGDAWQQAISQQPNLGLWATDGKHPSLLGSYLTASVFYGLLEDIDPMYTLYTAGLNDMTAARLRSYADTLLSRDWNLRIVTYGAVPVTAELRDPVQVPAKPRLQPR